MDCSLSSKLNEGDEEEDELEDEEDDEPEPEVEQPVVTKVRLSPFPKLSASAYTPRSTAL